jgi:hypothetical protein
MLDKSGPDTTKSLVPSGAFTRILGRRELSSGIPKGHGLKPRDWRSGLAVDPSHDRCLLGKPEPATASSGDFPSCWHEPLHN